jgi:drug/metabolite transporter (DMT)-like permease
MSSLEPADNARRASPLASGGVPAALPTHGALLVVQIAFAVGAVEGKLAMSSMPGLGGGVDPFALAMARMFGAAAVFQLFMRATGMLRPLPWREHLRIVGLSLLGIVVNQTLFLLGLRLTTAFAAVLLGMMIPVFTATFAVGFGLERPSVRTGVGFSVAFGGVLWLTGVGSLDWGALAIAANCLSYALYIVLSKNVIVRVGAFTMITWVFTWGAIVFAPFGARALVTGAASWSPRAWVLVAVVVAVQTILAYSVNAWALGRSGPTLVAAYIYLQPLVAAALQWVQLRQPIGPRAIVAAAFIFLGVAIVATRRPVQASASASLPSASSSRSPEMDQAIRNASGMPKNEPGATRT